MLNAAIGPGRAAEAHEQAARREAVERLREGVLADRVVDHRHALAAGELLHARDEILARVDDRVRAAVAPCASAAFSSEPTVPIIVTPSARAHWHAMRPTPPAAAWNRIVSPPLQRKGLAEQVLDRQALQHQRRGGDVVDAVGHLDQLVGGHHAARSRTRRAGRRNRRRGRRACTQSTPGAHRLDHARAFLPDARRQRQRIKTAAVIGVDVVDADRGVANARLAGARGRRPRLRPTTRTSGPPVAWMRMAWAWNSLMRAGRGEPSSRARERWRSRRR